MGDVDVRSKGSSGALQIIEHLVGSDVVIVIADRFISAGHDKWHELAVWMCASERRCGISRVFCTSFLTLLSLLMIRLRDVRWVDERAATTLVLISPVPKCDWLYFLIEIKGWYA